MRSKQLDSETLLTTAEVGALLQVHPNSVINWARQGEIICFRTPGGQRRIRAVDVVKFVKERGMPLPRYLLGLEAGRVVLLDLTAKDGNNLRKTARNFTAQVSVAADPLEAIYEIG